jgi:hypothetical protein
MFFITLGLFFAASVAAEVYDVIMTEKGIKAGVGEWRLWLAIFKADALGRNYSLAANLLILTPAPDYQRGRKFGVKQSVFALVSELNQDRR